MLPSGESLIIFFCKSEATACFGGDFDRKSHHIRHNVSLDYKGVPYKWHQNLSNGLKVRGHQNQHTHFIHFPESAEFSDNFDGNIGAPRFVNTEKNYI